MKKLFTFLALSVLMVVGAYAQWTKPAAPASVPLQTGETLYLYNPDADGFFLGANDWNTRASVSGTKGYKVRIEKYELDDISYYLADSVETKGQVMYTFIDGVESIWVDRNKADEVQKLFTFEAQDDGTYRIGLSPENRSFNPGTYPGAYLGLIPEKNDTRIYLCDTSTYYPPFYDPELWQTKWNFVTPSEYEAYVGKKQAYEAAVALKANIDKALAENEGIDVSSIQAVYDNTASTVEQLNKAAEDLVWLVVEFQTARVSVDTPADFTPYITNASYDNNNNEGWKGTTPGFQQYGNAEYYWCNYDTHQSLTGLKNGIYRVGLTGFYRAGWAENDAAAYDLLLAGDDSLQNAKLYAATTGMSTVIAPLTLASAGATADSIASGVLANTYGKIPNDMQAASEYVKAGRYPEVNVLVYVNDGTLTLGLKKERQLEGDWTILDAWKLYYLGENDDAFAYFASDYLGRSEDYETYIEYNEVYHYKPGYTAYLEARNTLAAATDAASIGAAIKAFDAAVLALEESFDAYTLFYAKYQDACAYMESLNPEIVYEDPLYNLSDYLYLEEEPSELYPNGTGLYILTNGTLNAEQVMAEIAFLEKLLADAIANALVDGTDCSNLLKNASFAEEGGWTKQPGVTFPTGGNPVGEGPNMVFDVHQELTNLQNGLYEFTVNACYQAADYTALTGEEQYKAYTYINSYQKLMNSVLADPASESSHAEDYNYPGKGYVPNSAASAYQAFTDGRYVQTVYGLVTDGSLRLGIRNDLRYADGSRAWWTGAKLIFRAMNVEILGEVITATVPEAQALLANKCGQPELDSLQTAISTATAATDEARYDALAALKHAMESVVNAVDNYAKLHTALNNLDAAIDEYAETASDEAVKNAEALYAEALAGYEAGIYNNVEAIAKVEAVNLAVVELKIPDMSGDEDEPVDVTSLIINNNFDPAKGDKATGVIEGWTTSAMNGYKQNTVSYNRAEITLYQDLVGLTPGKYKVTVQTYYRAGYYDEEWNRKESGEETHLTTLYAATADEKFEVKVKNLYEDAAATDYGVKCYTLANGMFAPDGTSSTVEFFKQGHYLNELEFVVGEDGKARIGLEKTEILANDYEVVGEWKLYYLGATEPEPVDMTSLIINPDFDPAKGDKNTGVVEGWTTSAMNGYKQNTVSYNRAEITLYQDLVGLMPGKYKVTVQTYYRAGYYDEEWNRKESGEETHLTTLYASTADDRYEVKVMNLYEDAATTDYGVKCYTLANGMFAPDGTSSTVEFFKQGHYLNELEFVVGEDGKARIGLEKTEILANDYEVVGPWKLYYLGEVEPTDPEPVDMTSLIINPDFDPAKGDKATGVIEGWTTSPMNGYKQNTVSYNRAAIDLYQDLVGLPEGKYEVTVHTYYRAGYYDEEWNRKENGEDTHLTTLYATTSDNKYETKVMNLYEDASATDYGVKCYTLPNGMFAPDGTTPTVEFFNQGHYLNKLQFEVGADGKVRIGLSKTEILGNDYEVVGAWHLYYLGKSEGGEGIEEVESAAPVLATEIYTLGGQRINVPQSGINIFRILRVDGSVEVQKVLVR